ncbi:hypothetical protein AOQ84DRAFT_358225 [Glonium stellatum]|uniref:Uncharacterized protein n=1 Tax=Glonium stellatum TaxID=574774 RepID=A0A8E2JZ84_9PEZI|nr:hypothetical protein AOQ84DRAFT_358225 [Glonium stellatum]
MDAKTYQTPKTRYETADMRTTIQLGEIFRPNDDGYDGSLGVSTANPFLKSALNPPSQERVKYGPTSGISEHIIESTCIISHKASKEEELSQKDVNGGIWGLTRQTLEPGELAPIRHLRLPVTRLPPLGIVPLAVSRVDNLRLETLTITPPALHKPWKLAGGYPSDLQELLDTITNIRSIIIDNNGYYSDWEFLLLFLRMHTFDQRINLKESFAIKSGLWEYKVQRRRKGGKYGYIVVMRALNYHDSEIVLLT